MRPFVVCLGEDAGGGLEEVGVRAVGVGVGEVGRLKVGGRGEGEGGGRCVEEEAVGEVAEAAEVVDGEGQECDVVGVDGLDDGGVGDGAVGASR